MHPLMLPPAQGTGLHMSIQSPLQHLARWRTPLSLFFCLALALAMLLRQGRTRLWMAFALLNVALLAYQIGDFLYGIFGAAPPWPLRLTLGAAGFIPVAVLGFIVEFQGESAGRVVGLRRFATATALATVAVAVLY